MLPTKVGTGAWITFPSTLIVPLRASERVARLLRWAGCREVAHLRYLPVILTCVAGTKTQKTVLWAL
jgi:hypothetical protein